MILFIVQVMCFFVIREILVLLPFIRYQKELSQKYFYMPILQVTSLNRSIYYFINVIWLFLFLDNEKVTFFIKSN